MKLTFYDNACCLYESESFRLLTDPWLSESCFENAWIHVNPLKTKPQDLLDVDALYISHLHQDHLDPETLKYFRRDIPIVTLKDKFSLCARQLEKLGFSNVIAIPDKGVLHIGPFDITFFAPFRQHPFLNCQVGNVVDSAVIVEAGGVKVLNANDNTPDIDSARWLGETYGPFDVAQINFNNASEYPCCFMNLSYGEKLAESRKCIARNLAHMAEVGRLVKAKQVMPFAGSFKLSEKWEHMNEYLGATTDKKAVAYLQEQGLRAFTLAEGESIHVE